MVITRARLCKKPYKWPPSGLFVLPMALSGLINTRILERKTDADISIAFSPFCDEELLIVGVEMTKCVIIPLLLLK